MSIDIRVERPTAAPMPPRLRQNAVGDVVIPAERGEIVALPRLWDFDLRVTGVDAGVLVTADGLRATVVFTDSTAIVESVEDEAYPRSAGAR
jgi:hypothetical protein